MLLGAGTHEMVKTQLIWVTREMVNVLGARFDSLLMALLEQIVGGDFNRGNLWLYFDFD